MAITVTVHQLLGTSVVTRAISRIKTPQTRFQDWLGMGPGGRNVNPVGGRNISWDIFDKTRSIARGRAPGTGPGVIAPNPIGSVSARVYRVSEKMFLLEERIVNTRPLGGQWGSVDARGQAYVTAQEGFMAQRVKNSREYLISRMFRGGWAVFPSGEDHIPVDLDTSGNAPTGCFKVDLQVPSQNFGQFADKMGSAIGSGVSGISATWATAGTDVVGDCLRINAAFEANHGRPLRDIWINSVVVGYLNTNTGLKNLGGTANVVFERFQPSNYASADGIPDTGFTVVYRGLPWLTFHVYDAGLNVYDPVTAKADTYTKYLDDTHAIFAPEPSTDWCEWIEGSEVVAENVTDPGTVRFGFHAWSTRVIDPAGWELKVVDNGLPALYIPKAIGYGTVVF